MNKHNKHNENIENMVTYFKAGEKKNGCVNAGVEIEHFVLDKNGKSAAYEVVVEILQEIKEERDSCFYEDGHLFGLYNEDYSLSLEPASQLEISIAPKEKLSDIEKIYIEFRKRAEYSLSRRGLTLVNKGYHPGQRAAELQLIPKKRYEYMNRYFATSGSLGKNMMRATASVQVSVDYANEKDFVEKYRLACILSPILSLITDNSPVFEGEKAEHALVRTRIWLDTDDKRCGIFPGTFSEGFGYRAYGEYLYGNPPILVMDKEGQAVYTGEKTAAQIYEQQEMTQTQIEHLISMFFPDVRLKKYVEIRMADSMELPYALAYAALIKTLFYTDKVRRELLSFFGKVSNEEIRAAKLSLLRAGYRGEAYHREVHQIVLKLVEEMEKNMTEEAGRYAECLLEKMRNGKRIFEN